MALRDDANIIEITTLVEATENGPVTIQRSGRPALVIMREKDYAALIDAATKQPDTPKSPRNTRAPAPVAQTQSRN